MVGLGNVEMRSYSENKNFTSENNCVSEYRIIELGDSTLGDGGTASVSGRWTWLAEGGDLGAAAAPHEKWECPGGKGAAFQVGLAVICALCSVHVLIAV